VENYTAYTAIGKGCKLF